MARRTNWSTRVDERYITSVTAHGHTMTLLETGKSFIIQHIISGCVVAVRRVRGDREHAETVLARRIGLYG